MKNIFVAFGGKSPEHDISCITACQVMNAIDKKKYNVYPLYISKDGEMFADKKLNKIENIAKFNAKKCKKCSVKIPNNQFYIGKLQRAVDVYSVIMCFHGGYGENGGMSALFDMCNMAYTASSAVPCGVAMDKYLSKTIAKSSGENVVDGELIKATDEYDLADIIAKYGKVVVKPNNLGSSIAVSTASNEKELKKALELAFVYTSEVLVEKCLKNFYEINVSLFKVHGEIMMSQMEQPLKRDEILTFRDKYMTKQGKNSGMKSLLRENIYNIDKNIAKKVGEIAKRLYNRIGLCGVVRFDFLIEGETIYFNEVNTIPGSMAFYLWDEVGINFLQLIDMMIEQSVNRREDRERIITSIDINVLETRK